jgi:hypothetical protein
MPDQNIGNIGWKKLIYFASKDLGEYKEKKFRSVMGVMVHIRHGAFCVLPKGENR